MMKIGHPVQVRRKQDSILSESHSEIENGFLVEPPVSEFEVQTTPELVARIKSAFNTGDIQGVGLVTVVGSPEFSGPLFTWRGTDQEFAITWELP